MCDKIVWDLAGNGSMAIARGDSRWEKEAEATKRSSKFAINPLPARSQTNPK